jgi:hypothetical protein
MATMLEVELLSSSASSASKELIENVFVAEMTPAKVHVRILTLLLSFHSLFTVLIIDASLLRVTQSLICIGYLLELLLCPVGIIFVLVWMIFDCKLLE